MPITTPNGYQPKTQSSSSRRADFDLQRRLTALQRQVDAMGGGTTQRNYRWSTNTTASDPGHGYVKANAAPASATTLYMSLYDGGDNAFLALGGLAVGDRIDMYESGALGQNIRYTVSGAPTETMPVNLSGSWATIPVTLVANNGFAPGNNADVAIVITTGSGSGGGGGLDQATADTRYVNIPGDTMTGTLVVPTVNSANAATALNVKAQGGLVNVGTATKQASGVVNGISVRGLDEFDFGPSISLLLGSNSAATGTLAANPTGLYVNAAALSNNDLTMDASRQIALRISPASTGLTLTNSSLTSVVPVVLPANPTTALQAATKQYVDARALATTSINTTAPLTGGGNLSADRTLAITSFAGSAAGAVPSSPGGTATYLRADGTWATPPTGGVPTTRLISTTAPLTGGGDLSADRTLAISNFTSSTAGAVPSSGGGTQNYLRADGTWAAPPNPKQFVATGTAITGSFSPSAATTCTLNIPSQAVAGLLSVSFFLEYTRVSPSGDADDIDLWKDGVAVLIFRLTGDSRTAVTTGGTYTTTLPASTATTYTTTLQRITGTGNRTVVADVRFHRIDAIWSPTP